MKMSITISIIIIFMCLTFFACTKKNKSQLESHVNISLYDQNPSVIQSYIQGKWQLQFESGGIGGSTLPVNQKIFYTFNKNRISIEEDGVLVTDTIIDWKYLAISVNGDSIFIMSPGNFMVNGIFSDTLLMHDAYISDAFFYHFSKLN
jgi:hypothetical protein